MPRQYKRSYELFIIPVDSDTRVIKDLRIRFEITKTVLSYPNLAKIEIFNPNKDTLSSLQRKYTKVILNLGYEGNLALVFKGQIRNVLQSKIGVDRIITIYAGDGEKDWQNSYINKTYSASVNIKSVIEDAISTFKETAKGVIEGLPSSPDNLMGETLSGATKDILDSIASEYDLEWSIQDGEFNINPISEPITSYSTIIVNALTGMIGSPTLTEIGADVTTLLNPSFKPKVLFKIESINSDARLGNLFFRNIKRTSSEGFYITQEVLFKGDSRESSWLSLVKGRRYSAI